MLRFGKIFTRFFQALREVNAYIYGAIKNTFEEVMRYVNISMLHRGNGRSEVFSLEKNS